ncbi:THAP domain-containing protein 3 isoform X1 [Ambystoma mexicanum]|uniref:THAP domain-containing protein 3 isoform X1 n=1 Tax=Ambystoma mexicanum TaxID=8296 RepID=UPI0037E91D95
MPKSCSVPYCKSRYSHSNKDVTFHRFPFSRPELLGEWIARIGYANFNPKRHTVICSTHFIPDCFSKYGNRKNLKENAIPTVFLSEEQRLEKLLQLQERVEKKNKLKKLRRKLDLQPTEEEQNVPETKCWKKRILEAAQATETFVEEESNFYCKKSDPHPIQVIDHSYAIGDSSVLKKKLYFALEDNEKLRKRMKVKNLKLRRMNENIKILENELQTLKESVSHNSVIEVTIN